MTDGTSLMEIRQQLHKDRELKTFPDTFNLIVGNNRSGKRKLLEFIARGRKCSVIREADISPYGRARGAVQDIIIVESNVIDCLDGSRKEHLAVHLMMLANAGHRVFAASADGYIFVHTVSTLVKNKICGDVSFSVLNMVDGVMTRYKSVYDIEPCIFIEARTRLYDTDRDMPHNADEKDLITSPEINRLASVVEKLKKYDINDVWRCNK